MLALASSRANTSACLKKKIGTLWCSFAPNGFWKNVYYSKPWWGSGLFLGSGPLSSLCPSRQDATAGLTRCFVPGDDLTIYGVVMQRWKPFRQDVRCEVEIVLKANYVQVNNEQSAGINMDEEVRKEFEDFWEYYKSDPFAGLC